MNLKVNYTATTRFNNRLRVLINGLPTWLYQFLSREASYFLEAVRRRTPIDTGRLQNSWRLESIGWQGKELTANFINDAYDGYAQYASFVEEGHSKPNLSGAGPGDAGWVRGAFMLKYTEKEMMRRLPEGLSAEITRLFKQHLG